MGPQKQLRMMFDPVRLYATAVYVGCVVLALIFALWVRIFELFLFFLSHGIILFFSPWTNQISLLKSNGITIVFKMK
jgi:hypothetical protein